ncbi:unnamed protein product, partial [Amoebophrya sp. A120]
MFHGTRCERIEVHNEERFPIVEKGDFILENCTHLEMVKEPKCAREQLTPIDCNG